MCSRPGWGRAPFEPAIPRSSTAIASAVSAPSAGSPVWRSQSSQGVRPISASANSEATSWSSPNSVWTARMAAAYSSLHGAQSSAGVSSGKRARSASISACSTGVPAPASCEAVVTAA
jgi:hypothetical protein